MKCRMFVKEEKKQLFLLHIKILQDARTLSYRLNHRGARSCDGDSGDGAGVMTAIPHSFYSSILRLDFF